MPRFRPTREPRTRKPQPQPQPPTVAPEPRPIGGLDVHWASCNPRQTKAGDVHRWQSQACFDIAVKHRAAFQDVALLRAACVVSRMDVAAADGTEIHVIELKPYLSLAGCVRILEMLANLGSLIFYEHDRPYHLSLTVPACPPPGSGGPVPPILQESTFVNFSPRRQTLDLTSHVPAGLRRLHDEGCLTLVASVTEVRSSTSEPTDAIPGPSSSSKRARTGDGPATTLNRSDRDQAEEEEEAATSEALQAAHREIELLRSQLEVAQKQGGGMSRAQYEAKKDFWVKRGEAFKAQMRQAKEEAREANERAEEAERDLCEIEREMEELEMELDNKDDYWAMKLQSYGRMGGPCYSDY